MDAGGDSRYKRLIPTALRKRRRYGSRYEGPIPTVRKKRSQTLRRPRRKYLTFPPSLGQLGNAGDAKVGVFKLIKLKLGRAAHIIETKHSSNGSSTSESAQSSNATQPPQILTPQANSSEESPPADKKSELKGISCEDFPGGTVGASNSGMEKMPKKKILPVYQIQNVTPQDNSSEDGPLEDKKNELKAILCEEFPGGTVGANRSGMEKMPTKKILPVYRIQYPYTKAPPLPRKRTEMPSEVEAAQRCIKQNEKAARESEAEVRRTMLGQDSDRKKEEEKMKTRQEELAQEKVANELPPNTIRTVLGPTGTILTFSDGLPSIFNSKPCSYPPPREKCAGPSCENTYKYRDLMTMFPLCCFECYKAIHKKMQDDQTG